MKYIKHLYADPTGGGEDASLTAPEWADAPLSLTLYGNGERYQFDKYDEEEVDE